MFKNINLSTLDHHKMSGMNTNTRQILERDKNIELKNNNKNIKYSYESVRKRSTVKRERNGRKM